MLPRNGPTNGQTFEFESNLPKFPLPLITETKQRVLEACQPFADNADEYQSFKQQVDSANLEPIQSLLRERFEQLDNYVHGDWWSKYAYLEERSPITPIESTPLDFSAGDSPTRIPQRQRAAMWLKHVGDIHAQLLRQEIPCCGFSAKEPITMEQFKSLYETCRVPGREFDVQNRYFNTADGARRRREVILGINGRMFAICLDSEPAKCPLSVPALELLITDCEMLAYSSNAAAGEELPDLGYFTGGPRTLWAHAREELIKADAHNYEVLLRVEKAIAFLTLDDFAPQDNAELLYELSFPRNPASRFFDKSSQLVVFRNGMAGSSMEHSVMDVASQLLTHQLTEDLNLQYLKTLSSRTNPPRFVNLVEPLRFKNVPKSVQADLHKAKEDYNRRRFTTQNPWKSSLTRLHGVGRTFCKSLGVSPDSFLQMAYQATYYDLYSKIPSTYESVGVLRFRWGRTETGRCVSNVSKEFAMAAVAPQSAENLHAVAALLKRACVDHEIRIKNTSLGKQGFDRHLFAIRCQCRESGIPLPQFLTHPLLSRASQWDLSTSNAFIGGSLQQNLGGTSFRPVGEDSIGIVYAIFPDCCDLNVMSTKPQYDADQFLRKLATMIAYLSKALLVLAGANPNKL